MTPLESYLDSRFGPVFGLLEDNGGVPDELLECLKRGAIVEAMEYVASLSRPDVLRYGGITVFNTDEMHGWYHSGPDPTAESLHKDGEEAVFALFTKDTDFLTKHIDQPTT